MIDKILPTLESVFGYTSFRLKQEDIIKTVIKKKDCLAIMPTGGGKSICYQLPAILFEGLTVVVSPLIALMNDQVEALKLLNIPAATINSNQNQSEIDAIYASIRTKQLKLLYISPERLMAGEFLSYLANFDIDLFAIDEAHCVSVWGNDFRPEYIKLRAIKEKFPAVPVIALTATADAATQKDIKVQLGLQDATMFLSSFERTNIFVQARSGQKRIEQIEQFLSKHKGDAGIVYCLSRKGTEDVASKLIARGFKASYYHAGMNGEDRTRIQRNFQNDEVDIVCATIAFGMGIDKPNIRFVIHYNMPKNIESFYQEIGRAGRDGEEAQSLLFYSWGDFINLKKFIDEGEATDAFKKVQNAKLERMWQYASAQYCRTNLILNYFGEYRAETCMHCDNCIDPPQIIDGSTYAKMAISAILRCEEKLTKTMLGDVLKGAYKPEITTRGFDKVKTFGVGREVPASHWSHYITQMINQGIIQLDFSDYSRLKITPLSMKVLKENQKVPLTAFTGFKKKQPVKIIKTAIDPESIDKGLLEILKTWRNQLAKEKNVPAYIVLSNKTLQNIAAEKPISKPELLRIGGIGEAKLQNYGEAILNIVLQNQDS